MPTSLSHNTNETMLAGQPAAADESSNLMHEHKPMMRKFPSAAALLGSALADDFGRLTFTSSSARSATTGCSPPTRLDLSAAACSSSTAGEEVSPAASRVTSPEPPHFPQQLQQHQHQGQQQPRQQQQPQQPRRTRRLSPDISPGIRGCGGAIEKSPRSPKQHRLERMPSSPSISNLVAFAGAVRADNGLQSPGGQGLLVGGGGGGMRRTKSLQTGMSAHDSSSRSSVATAAGLGEARCPWQRFAEWKVSHPEHTRAEATAFIERALATASQ